MKSYKGNFSMLELIKVGTSIVKGRAIEKWRVSAEAVTIRVQ